MTPGVEDTDFSSLRMITYGASPISEKVLVASMERFGCDFAQAYGLTETSGGVVLLHPEDHDPGGPRAHRLRAAGRAVPGVELRIVDRRRPQRADRRDRRGVDPLTQHDDGVLEPARRDHGCDHVATDGSGPATQEGSTTTGTSTSRTA